jgi:hypothetical protein
MKWSLAWVPKQIRGLDFGVVVREQQLVQAGGTYIVSHHYEPEIKTPEDVEKIKIPEVAYDEAATLAEKEFYEEFALGYENEVMERCGLNYYGCCEPAHNKMHLMAKVPRLRKISISPWCNVEKAAAEAREKYVFSHKPSPAILAEDRFNVARAEQDLRDRLAKSGGMPCEFIMKDISTIRGDVERLIAWCEMAYRVVRE